MGKFGKAYLGVNIGTGTYYLNINVLNYEGSLHFNTKFIVLAAGMNEYEPFSIIQSFTFTRESKHHGICSSGFARSPCLSPCLLLCYYGGEARLSVSCALPISINVPPGSDLLASLLLCYDLGDPSNMYNTVPFISTKKRFISTTKSSYVKLAF